MRAIPDRGQRTELEPDAGGGVAERIAERRPRVRRGARRQRPIRRATRASGRTSTPPSSSSRTTSTRRASRPMSGRSSATCSRSSPSTPTRPPSRLDRRAVEQAFAFACERHADQRRRSGEDFITHPVEVAKICAGLRLDTETLCAALLHDTVEDTSASLDEVRELFGESDRRPGRRRHQADRDHVPEPRREPGRELPEDDGGDGHRRAGHPDQARRPPPQHAHDRRAARRTSRSRRRARRSRSTRRSPTGWGSTRSSGSWRTSRSSACTRASTTRSRSSSPSSATSASAT